jgi:hypothetical protein
MVSAVFNIPRNIRLVDGQEKKAFSTRKQRQVSIQRWQTTLFRSKIISLLKSNGYDGRHAIQSFGAEFQYNDVIAGEKADCPGRAGVFIPYPS